MNDIFSKQFTKGRKIRMNCWNCHNDEMIIDSKNCQNMGDYKSCIIFVKCSKCQWFDDFFINKDYYGYIDSDAEPLNGEWKK